MSPRGGVNAARSPDTSPTPVRGNVPVSGLIVTVYLCVPEVVPLVDHAVGLGGRERRGHDLGAGRDSRPLRQQGHVSRSGGREWQQAWRRPCPAMMLSFRIVVLVSGGLPPCWRDDNSHLTDRQQHLDWLYEPDAEVQPPRSRAAERADPDAADALFAERGYEEVTVEDIASAAGVARGLVHHYFGGRKQVSSLCLNGSAPCARNDSRRQWAAAPARASPVALRWLDWSEQTADLAGHARARRGHRRPRRQARRHRPCEPRRRAPRRSSRRHRRESPRLRYALECWTGLTRAATRRSLQGEGSREQTHEVIASTLEHVLRTFGAPPKPGRAAA